MAFFKLESISIAEKYTCKERIESELEHLKSIISSVLSKDPDEMGPSNINLVQQDLEDTENELAREQRIIELGRREAAKLSSKIARLKLDISANKDVIAVAGARVSGLLKRDMRMSERLASLELELEEQTNSILGAVDRASELTESVSELRLRVEDIKSSIEKLNNIIIRKSIFLASGAKIVNFVFPKASPGATRAEHRLLVKELMTILAANSETDAKYKSVSGDIYSALEGYKAVLDADGDMDGVSVSVLDTDITIIREMLGDSVEVSLDLRVSGLLAEEIPVEDYSAIMAGAFLGAEVTDEYTLASADRLVIAKTAQEAPMIEVAC